MIYCYQNYVPYKIPKHEKIMYLKDCIQKLFVSNLID